MPWEFVSDHTLYIEGAADISWLVGQIFKLNSAVFFDITILKPAVVGNMLAGLITLCLFAYLFYKFADMLSEFAAELTA